MTDPKLTRDLLDFNTKAKKKGGDYPKKRNTFEKVFNETEASNITALSGLRGSGKTVILCQLLKKLENAFYISCDTLPSDVDLYKLIKEITENYGLKYILLDEIHFYKKWPRALKLAYDFLPVKIFFTSSVSLNILECKHDLSRRVKIIENPIFSFAEYLEFKHNRTVPTMQLEEILKKYQKIFPETFYNESYFEEYLESPLPFMLENKSKEAVQQICEKIIEKDLFHWGKFTSADIGNLKNLMNFIVNCPISDINYSVLSQNLGITKYKAKLYTEFLEKGYLLHAIKPYSSNVRKEPKIIVNIPFRQALHRKLNQDSLTGALREEFFVGAMAKVAESIFYLKSKRGRKTPDYLIKHNGASYVFEIGGKSKTFTQFKGLKRKNLPKYLVTYPGTTDKGKIPLMLFGMLQ